MYWKQTVLDLPFERLSDEDMSKIQKTIKEWRKEYKAQIDDKFIVYGHTHRPYVDKANKEANTGSWVDDPEHARRSNFAGFYFSGYFCHGG